MKIKWNGVTSMRTSLPCTNFLWLQILEKVSLNSVTQYSWQLSPLKPVQTLLISAKSHVQICLCCSSLTLLLELGRYLTTARWNWGLKSAAKLSQVLAQLGFHIMISFCMKKDQGGMELNFSLPKHLIPIILLLLCPKLYLNCISGRFWDVWYRSPAITSDVVSFRTVEPDVKCERCKK